MSESSRPREPGPDDLYQARQGGWSRGGGGGLEGADAVGRQLVRGHVAAYGPRSRGLRDQVGKDGDQLVRPVARRPVLVQSSSQLGVTTLLPLLADPAVGEADGAQPPHAVAGLLADGGELGQVRGDL